MKLYRQVHEQYLIEWLAASFPPGSWRTNVRVGAKLLPGYREDMSDDERALLSAFAASADAIVTTPKEYYIIEAMVRHEPGAGEDLLKYRELLPYTEGYEDALKKSIIMVILTPLELGWYQKFYERLGIIVVKYTPPWILEYLHTYPRYEWRGKLSAMKEMK